MSDLNSVVFVISDKCNSTSLLSHNAPYNNRIGNLCNRPGVEVAGHARRCVQQHRTETKMGTKRMYKMEKFT